MRQLRVESIDTTEGDKAVVERAALVDEITDDLATIEGLETLEEVHAEIRHRRPHGSATTDAEEDTSE